MSTREESLTLYALSGEVDGSTDCPRCAELGCAGIAVLEPMRDLNDLALRGIAGRFECLCCGYAFLGVAP